MAYNNNPIFLKHGNNPKNNLKHMSHTWNKSPDSNISYNNTNRQLKNFGDVSDEIEPTKYKLDDIDHPNGWSFNELDMLGDMGFSIYDDHQMMTEIDIESLKMENEKIKTLIYKTEEGYTLKTNRKYIFETFEKLIEFIDSTPTLGL